jgi:hypothetical protein
MMPLNIETGNFTWLQEKVKGPMIHESPDGGKTIRSRVAADHPIFILTRGLLPIDIWYKVYGGGYET